MMVASSNRGKERRATVRRIARRVTFAVCIVSCAEAGIAHQSAVRHTTCPAGRPADRVRRLIVGGRAPNLDHRSLVPSATAASWCSEGTPMTDTAARAATVAHPLEMLTADEITRATQILRANGNLPDGALFAHIVLHEPDKDALAAWKAGDP